MKADGCISRAGVEERFLTAAFGSEYLDYHRQVLPYLGRRKGVK